MKARWQSKMQASEWKAIPECTVRSKKSRLERVSMLLKHCLHVWEKFAGCFCFWLKLTVSSDPPMQTFLHLSFRKNKWKKPHVSTAGIPSYFWPCVTLCILTRQLLDLNFTNRAFCSHGWCHILLGFTTETY